MTPASYLAMIRRKGAALAWRARTGTGAAQSPPTISGAVTTSAAALAGAAVVSIRAGYAVGQLVAGDEITIAGTTHAVTGPVSAAANVFAAVPITPALPADVAQGSAVALAFAADTSVDARIAEYTAKELVGGIQAGDMRAIIAAQDCSITPAIGHEAIIDGVAWRVLNVSRKTWGDALLGWEAQARK